MMFLEATWLGVKQSVLGCQGSRVTLLRNARFVLSEFVIIVSLWYVVFSANSFASTRGFVANAVGIGWGRGLREGFSKLNIEGSGNVWLPSDQVDEITGVTGYIKAKTNPGEPIFGFPEMGIYHFFANRPNVTRFPIATVAAMTPRYTEEILSALKVSPPRYIIYDPGRSAVAASIRKKTEDLLPDVVKYVNEKYHVEEKVGDVLILRRN
jgi:hypothetical protein